ncbi:BRICHOS domain-containing protein 5 [Larimichthys crocea]|uniref:BRICHOS domain-containing protein 5 n=1 Tax=Larimichthys crocea TaxID=215358 RepID=A0A6G0HZ36_LARCR|nr:BRICHOS domain-containing protein 5 [Larimichthys crocea]
MLKVTLGCHRLDAATVRTAYHLSPDERGFPNCTCLTSLSIVRAGEGGQFLPDGEVLETFRNRLEEAQCTDGGSAASSQSHFPHKAFWVSLSASLLLVIVALGLTGHLGLSQPHSRSSQIVRITVPDQTGVLINQSAVVDQQNDLVTFSVTSTENRTSTVLFDIKHGLICYKPVDQESCFLQKMEESDYDNVHSLLQESTQSRGQNSSSVWMCSDTDHTCPQQSQFQLSGNETQRQTEFLGVLAASQVDVSTLEEPLQALCQERSVLWTRRADGPGKQRLVYFCIDICFPSNICVSVCFYYLPE